MNNFCISGRFDPRKEWRWLPKISQSSWPVADRHANVYDVKYLNIQWLGLQISLDNERD